MVELEHDPERAPVLAMDGIRVATLITLAALVLFSVFQGVYIVTNTQQQREINECYQRLLDDVVSWANAAVPAGIQDRQAQRELLTADPATREEALAARDRYLQKLDEADRTRSSARVPTQRCAR